MNWKRTGLKVMIALFAVGSGASYAQGQCDLNLEIEVNHVSCHGESDGSITLISAEPNDNYEYIWASQPGTVGQPGLQGLTANTYTAVVTNTDGCTEVIDIEVNEPDPLVAYSHSRAVCQASSVQLLDSIRGGTQPYDISWSTSAGVNCMNCGSVVNANTSNQYSVLIMDFNGCTTTQSLNIDVSNQIAADVQVDSDLCGGDGSITVVASGGSGPLTYFVNGVSSPSNTFNGYFGGEVLEVFIYDTTNCFHNETVVMPSALLPTEQDIFSSDITCPGANDGMIDILTDGTNILSYALDDPAAAADETSFSEVPAGSHVVYVTDVNGCVTEHVVDIEEPVAPELANSVQNCSCFGADDGQVAMNPLGGTLDILFYELNNAVQFDALFTNLPPGTYTTSVQSLTGCEVEETITISEPPEIQDTAFVADCNCWDSQDGEISMLALGGAGDFTFSSNAGFSFQASPEFNELQQGEYNIIIKDSTGCEKTRQVIVEAPDTLEMAPLVTPPTCPDLPSGEIVIIVSGGTQIYEYSLDEDPFGDVNTFTNLEPGVYTTKVKDSNGCERETLVEVEAAEEPETEIEKVFPSCSDSPNGEIVIIVSGGTQVYSYSMNGVDYQSSNTFVNLLPGDYTVYLKNDSGCVFTYDQELEGGPAMDLDIATSTWTYGATIDLTVYGGTPPFTFDWSNGDSTEDINVEDNGTYTVEVRDDNNCPKLDSATIRSVSIFDPESGVTMELYPNPTVNQIRLTMDKESTEAVQFAIVDSRGRHVRAVSFKQGQKQLELDVSDLAGGTYQLSNGTVSLPFLKR